MLDQNKSKDFLRSIVANDLKEQKYNKIITRFPPEPNGYPHIGHAKSICINFGIAKDFEGFCHLRMDDTNPSTEKSDYVEALKEAVKWLGFSWHGELRYTSDYFDELYSYAQTLIKMGKAYVDSINDEELSLLRGTLQSAGKRSKYANRSVEENLELFTQMKEGKFPDGACVLRAKIDMANPNMKMRDPLLYRIRHAHHHRTGKKWCIYPMYDFAHCLSDYIEGITHSICTLEFENNRELYDWILEALNLPKPRPYQHEFARLNLSHTLMSKRKLLALVNEGKVSGWDDPRMPTIAGLKRRGYTPESIKNFCENIGISKANSLVDTAMLEFAIRDDLNTKAPRALAVFEPLKLSLINYDEVEFLDAPYFPSDVPHISSRKLPFSKDLYIEKSDFCANPAKDYHRLSPTQPVRLRHAYIIEFVEAIKNEKGEIIEIKAKIIKNSKSGSDTSNVKVHSAIQWLSIPHAKKAQIRLYDKLFLNPEVTNEDEINDESLKIIEAFVEPEVINDENFQRFQFERLGYFIKDEKDFSQANPVFNRIVTLKDSYHKKEIKAIKEEKKEFYQGEVTPLSEEEKKHFDELKALNLGEEVANTIARDEALHEFFIEAKNGVKNPVILANLIANELANEIKNQNIKSSYISELANLLNEEIISNKIAKEVLSLMLKTGENPSLIVEKNNLAQISDEGVIGSFLDEVIANNKAKFEEFKNGNDKLTGFFVGAVLKLSCGKANPKIVQKLVEKIR